MTNEQAIKWLKDYRKTTDFTMPQYGEALDMAIKAFQEQADGEKSFKMRDATPEEQEAIDKYIKSISKPTGVNVFDFYEDEEQEQIDFVQPKKKIPCTIKVQADEWQKKPHWIMKHRTINEVKYHTGLDDMGEEHTIKELIRYEIDEPYCFECGMKAGDTSQNYCCFCGTKMGGE